MKVDSIGSSRTTKLGHDLINSMHSLKLHILCGYFVARSILTSGNS